LFRERKIHSKGQMYINITRWRYRIACC